MHLIKDKEHQIEQLNGDIECYHKLTLGMIEDALRQHDQELQVNVQTTLNGKPTTMTGLVSDIKK